MRTKALPEAEEVGEVNELLKQAVRRTRGLARTIFPVKLEENGLVSALQELATTATRAYGIDCRLECPDSISICDSTSATHVYRIAQEALGNAVRHGQATAVTFTLTRHEAWISVVVEDNGRGFPSGPAEQSDGMGLRIMRYRSHMIGGSLSIQSSTSGVRVTCSFRYPAPTSLADPAVRLPAEVA